MVSPYHQHWCCKSVVRQQTSTRSVKGLLPLPAQHQAPAPRRANAEPVRSKFLQCQWCTLSEHGGGQNCVGYVGVEPEVASTARSYPQFWAMRPQVNEDTLAGLCPYPGDKHPHPPRCLLWLAWCPKDVAVFCYHDAYGGQALGCPAEILHTFT